MDEIVHVRVTDDAYQILDEEGMIETFTHGGCSLVNIGHSKATEYRKTWNRMIYLDAIHNLRNHIRGTKK